MSRIQAPVLCGLRCGASTARARAEFAPRFIRATSDFVVNDRLAKAIKRLDAALVRVERASDRVAAKPDPEFARLMQRHARLRERAQEAIQAIDRLTGAA